MSTSVYPLVKSEGSIRRPPDPQRFGDLHTHPTDHRGFHNLRWRRWTVLGLRPRGPSAEDGRPRLARVSGLPLPSTTEHLMGIGVCLSGLSCRGRGRSLGKPLPRERPHSHPSNRAPWRAGKSHACWDASLVTTRGAAFPTEGCAAPHPTDHPCRPVVCLGGDSWEAVSRWGRDSFSPQRVPGWRC